MVREECDLRSRTIQRERFVIAAAAEEHRRRTGCQRADEGTVLRRIARHHRVRQHLGTVIEREREHIGQSLFRAAREIAKHQRLAVAAPVRGRAGAAPPTASPTGGGTRRATRCRVGVGGILRHIRKPGAVVAHQPERAHGGNRRHLAIGECRPVRRGRKRAAAPARHALHFCLRGLGRHDDILIVRRELRRRRRRPDWPTLLGSTTGLSA